MPQYLKCNHGAQDQCTALQQMSPVTVGKSLNFLVPQQSFCQMRITVLAHHMGVTGLVWGAVIDMAGLGKKKPLIKLD